MKKIAINVFMSLVAGISGTFFLLYLMANINGVIHKQEQGEIAIDIAPLVISVVGISALSYFVYFNKK